MNKLPKQKPKYHWLILVLAKTNRYAPITAGYIVLGKTKNLYRNRPIKKQLITYLPVHAVQNSSGHN